MSLSKFEVWNVVHAERQRLLEDLAAVSGPAWEIPSLCDGWTVHDVLAHLIDTAETGKAAFIWGMLRTRGDFDRANDNGLRGCKYDDPQDTLAHWRRVLHLTKTPPAPPASRLVEAIVHGEDIRRPLGIRGDYPAAGVHDALAYQLRTSASLGGSRERAEGCRLVDSGTGTSWGDGREVAGAAIDLLLAATGRMIAPGLLTGPGADRLLRSS